MRPAFACGAVRSHRLPKREGGAPERVLGIGYQPWDAWFPGCGESSQNETSTGMNLIVKN